MTSGSSRKADIRAEENDWVLDGEDVAFLAGVDVVDHRGERGGLTGAGFTRDQNQAVVDVAKIHHRLGKLQFLSGARFRGDGAEHRAHAVQLAHDVDSKSGHTRNAVGEVGSVLGLETLHRQFRHDFVQGGLDHLGRERLRHQRLEFPVLADAGRVAGDEVQVRAVPLQHLSQIAVDGGHGGQEPRGMRLRSGRTAGR
jgi:hypothetical protein